MKVRGPIFLSVIALTFIIAAFLPKTVVNEEKESLIMRTVLSFVDQLHYHPKGIDDQFSENLYDYYLNRVDGARRYLTQEQIEQLESYKLKLDDEAKAGSFDFFNTTLNFLNEGIVKAENIYQEVLDESFDFTVDESFELDPDKRGFAEDDAELKEYWRKSLKYEVLTRVTRRLEKQKDLGEEGETKSIEQLEEEARQEVREVYQKYFKRIGKLKREDRMSGYLNSITQLFDPHSGYYKPIDKENFDIRMSGEYEGIGARLMLDGDYTTVSEVMAGGPAWKSKKIQEKDVFLKVAQGDEEEWQDLVGWVLDDVVQLIRGKKGTKVRLMVQSTDGTTKEISLIRDKIKTEETFAKSLILDGPEGDGAIGYIFLPSFYANFSDPNGRSCAKDVAKEVEKLKAENVDGIILDLRSNGGGSLADVIDMTGLFIEKGPIVQVKSRKRPAQVYRDSDAKVQYDGPLAVMTNGFSASASEILAGALQDYKRAVIVGSKSTHGKGTVQRFWDMDRVVRGMDKLKPLGSVKITTQKFYRVDGSSTQLRGVTPDIILPDTYDELEIGEEREDNPLSWTEIDAVDFNQNVYVIEGKTMDKLRKKSQDRIKSNKSFNMVIANSKRLAKNRDESTYPLSLDGYKAFSDARKAEADKFKDMFKGGDAMVTNNLKADFDYIHENEKNEALNEEFVKAVSKDAYIKETIHILHDLINIKR